MAVRYSVCESIWYAVIVLDWEKIGKRAERSGNSSNWARVYGEHYGAESRNRNIMTREYMVLG